MLFVVAILFLLLLCLCKRLSRTAFAVVEGCACFIWVFVQYWVYFQDLVDSVLPLWMLASLVALAVPTRRRIDEEDGIDGISGPGHPEREVEGGAEKPRTCAGFPFRGGRNG